MLLRLSNIRGVKSVRIGDNARAMRVSDMPPFRPARWLRSGHAQTIVGSYLAGRSRLLDTQRHSLVLADGDQLVLHDDCPATWQPGDRMALLIHGLGGCYASPYMRRIAARLFERNVRVVRLDLRGSGAGEHLARMPYHAGLTADLLAAIEHISGQSPGSPVVVAGFSLGGNMLLKLLGELGPNAAGKIERAVAVCPPIDLHACAARLAGPSGRLYDRYFVRLLCRRLDSRQRRNPNAIAANFARRPGRLREFDDLYTARVSGFRDVSDYYDRASSAGFIPAIRVPTWIIASRDDPVVDCRPFERISYPSPVSLTLTDHGGHLGYLGRRGVDRDHFWLDWRCVDWLAAKT
jgi:predicted alpha/beta-fold hydrolase